ncbi:MAG: heavy metal translocating P-type ATPase [Methanomicrobiales archaeon]|nr:heavy metal translocating P-type ATPase [Methanomicrobiales archaeon]
MQNAEKKEDEESHQSTSIGEQISQCETVSLPIIGMHCAACANTVASALKNVTGVQDATVDIIRETAFVTYNPSEASISQMIHAVELAGFSVHAKVVKHSISGMHCAACVRGLTTELRATPGVLSASVHLPSESATIVYNPSVIDDEMIVSAVYRAGFQVAPAPVAPDSFSQPVGFFSRFLSTFHINITLFRILLGATVSLLLMWLMMTMHDHMQMTFISWIIATPVMIWVGWPIFMAAWNAISHLRLSMEVMYAMGILVAYLGSIISMLHLISDFTLVLFETSVMLATFFLIGRFLEGRAKEKSNSAISSLIALQAQTALLLPSLEEGDAGAREVPADTIQHGDLVLMKTGARFPCDGIVAQGSGSVSEAMITGEPMPVLKEPGGMVIGGTVLEGGSLVYRATATGSESVLAGIIRLIEEAQHTRPHVASLADRVVSWFIPTVLAIAILVSIYWYFRGMSLSFIAATFISILVVACPCALGLAIPTAVTVGIGRGASLGILVKNSRIFEVADDLSVLLFDKTGTITSGKPQVTEIVSYSGDQSRASQITMALESKTSHPLGDIIVHYLKENKEQIDATEGLSEIEAFSYIPGKGAVGKVHNKPVIAGSLLFAKEQLGIIFSDDMQARARAEQDQGHTIVCGGDSKDLSLFIIADTVRENACHVMSTLRKMQISPMIVSGDSKRAVESVGLAVGLSPDEIVAEVLPEGKVHVVSRLQEDGRRVAFVGDGINDAPALRRCDCGIAIGSGTDVAIEAGDLVLIRDDIILVPAAVQLARKVMQRIRQNLFWACAYNVVLIPLAAGVFYPAVTFRPEYGALAMAFSSVSVVSLSLLLKWYIPPVMKHVPESATSPF